MSRKLILALTAAALGSATLGIASADAFPARGGKSFMHTPPQRIKVLVREPRGPRLPPPVWIHHHHPHWWHPGLIMAGGHPAYDAAPVAAAPGPCTCLTKDYTPEGLVIFKDVCTKETATTVVPGSPAAAQLQQQQQEPQSGTAPSPQQSGEIAAPSSFAGKTYQDFMASQQQAAAKQN